jgi:hypothetical protein
MIYKLADAVGQQGAVGLLVADDGSGSSESFATQPTFAATGGDINPASILAPATGGGATSGSASLAGTTVQMGSARGLVFNISYDSSVSSAPAGFTSHQRRRKLLRKHVQRPHHGQYRCRMG